MNLRQHGLGVRSRCQLCVHGSISCSIEFHSVTFALLSLETDLHVPRLVDQQLILRASVHMQQLLLGQPNTRRTWVKMAVRQAACTGMCDCFAGD
jgi:hypothetical protein